MKPICKFLSANFALLIATAMVVFLEGTAVSQEPISKGDLDFFETRIRPVLIDKCYACHSEKENESQGGLLLDTRSGIRRGGDSGAAAVPGKVSSSLLIAAIRHTNDDLVMPPEDSGEKLSESVIRDFETWIRRGAPDPRDGEAKVVSRYDTAQARSWWSFQPIQSSIQPPQIAGEHSGWPVTDIDRFVAAKWDEYSLSPMSDAEPETLLRRIRFDLTGLPPTEQEIAFFTRHWKSSPQSRDDLLEKVVDALLNSHEYAERWGRHWLDIARYAESSGKDVNLVYPHAWRYRDYVIESFHKDKPFDQFVREQIAGDLLPANDANQEAEQLTATAFLAIGENPLNERNPKQFAVDLADDQIAAVSQAFLGITVACARCHDHRFDPVSQRDYTALAGIFLSTKTKYGTAGAVGGRNRASLIELPQDAGLPIVSPGMSYSDIRSKQQKMERLQSQQRSARAQRAGGGRATDGLTDFDLVRINTQVSQLEFELSIVNDDGSPKALAMGVSDRPADAPQTRGPGGERGGPGRGGPGGFNQRGASRSSQGRSSGGSVQENPFAQQGQRSGGPGMRRGFGPRGFGPPSGPGQRGPGQQRQRGPSARPGESMMAGGNQPTGAQRNGRNRSSGFEQIGDSPLFLRGSIDNVGAPIPRGIPALLGSGTDIQIRRGSGRLELADALVSDRNTLTARVIVNRVWHWLFGRGLVESVDNFGTSGAQPSHPELLDYLAANFVRDGWSIKRLIREITLSRVYRMSSQYDAGNFAADPDNAMLWRHNSRRLEAEEVRDAILAASGQIDFKPGSGSMIGKAGDGPIGGLRFQAVTLEQISQANDRHRSIYLPATRSVEPSVLAVFDPADSSGTDGERDATNVPSQALFMLNSDFVAEQCKALADLAIHNYPGRSTLSQFQSRLEFVFIRVLNRKPTDSEATAARKLLTQMDASSSPWTSLVRGVFGSAEFRFVD
ncbi:MAG: PSD1 and planctomycete cytochrome C domain-containing protein [Rubripirellula sp.]